MELVYEYKRINLQSVGPLRQRKTTALRFRNLLIILDKNLHIILGLVKFARKKRRRPGLGQQNVKKICKQEKSASTTALRKLIKKYIYFQLTSYLSINM
jgi:hypothetical protein